MKTKEEILKSLNTRERARLFTGKNSWELEEIEGKNIFLSDGPHGLRKEETRDGRKYTVKAVCYPAACLSACSFDEELFKRYGEELAKECIHNKVDVLLGPGINIKRNPRCGRNFEYFSEDPLLSGKLGARWIDGVQGRNVGVSLKHLALNSQEEGRFINSSIADEKALREIYLKAFEIAVKEAHPWTVMASYNRIDGIHACENRKILTDIMRKEFGFDGIFVSDWGAIENTVRSLEAGLDLEMPGLSKGSSKRILEAIESGKLPESVLDESTERLIELYLKTEGAKFDDFDMDHALDVAREIAEKSIVLLKNEDKILPLRENSDILVVGDFADRPRYQGGGSSEINPLFEESLLEVLEKENIPFEFSRGYVTEDLEPDTELIRDAVEKARNKDAVIVVCGLPRVLESEGYDRESLDMPLSHLKLIEEISKVNENIVIVLQNGSPVLMPFLPRVKAVLETYLGGSKHAEALENILYGRVNPSGRLAETFPLRYEDVPSSDTYLSDRNLSLYKESIYVGYRYYDKAKKPVLFPFGYGLSYSETEWKDMEAHIDGEKVTATVTLKNLGDMKVTETVQVYAGLKGENLFSARKELRAFRKVELEAGEEKRLEISFPLKDLSAWSLKEGSWKLARGRYRVYTARNVMDESLHADIEINTGGIVIEDVPECYRSFSKRPSDEEFFSLLKEKPQVPHTGKPFTPESTLGELTDTVLGKLVLKPILKKIVKDEPDPNNRKMFEKAIPTQPIRSVQLMFPVSKSAIEGIVDAFNGHPLKGLRKARTDDDI